MEEIIGTRSVTRAALLAAAAAGDLPPRLEARMDAGLEEIVSAAASQLMDVTRAAGTGLRLRAVVAGTQVDQRTTA